ncbi:DUF423 domain-containing protein [Salisediminibacterium halotolerans]|uniref:DUF423 domain-containing protein n=1 Tax=Salisediminibacterium halotolerans TaxID=517425 RepID=UPI000EAC3B0A|nr:DUF423 domain-containing protein [Salisediminibacterium halotolerans]RLJ69652.1 uncharacterized membrane protein YgdD (TMEM256/DUF423 family) [Actinophytocola xinjiangensis]RPE89710.1 uncharacterized membrane protein YgdD (TMEM256/DUF423 family) [Salisediminibacterium halotolerans]TWG32546.1 uncharacterized membrane protein YgdD (TMEM256/DUF423 family) [Salisediminibacterium halotolerans]GEL08437.1 UPF0382 membrane protein YwdK [Salisediminibacterium halotolerans]
MKLFLIIASVFGFLFVAIGAFGAHALSERLAETGRTETFETGVLYHMIHTVAILAVAILTRYLSATGLLYGAGWAFTAGIIIFSGSLYALSLTGIRVFGAITPIGGAAFLAGWVLIFIAAVNE